MLHICHTTHRHTPDADAMGIRLLIVLEKKVASLAPSWDDAQFGALALPPLFPAIHPDTDLRVTPRARHTLLSFVECESVISYYIHQFLS